MLIDLQPGLEGEVTWTYTPFAGVLWTTAFISAFVAYLLSRRRAIAGANSITLLMCAVAEWSFASGLEVASIGLGQKIIWAKIEYLGSLSAPTFFLIFAIDYSQRIRWLTLRNILLLSIVPAAAWVLTLTNEWHHLIWNSFTPSPIEPTILIYGHGVGYFIILAYSCLLIFAGFLILMRLLIHSPQPYRRQVGIILVGSLFPIVIGIIYSVGWNPFPGLEITPVAFLVTGILLAIGIFMYQLFDLVPIARESLIENMQDGILVLDVHNRIVDVNPAAEKFINLLSRNSIGQPIESAFTFWPELMKRFQADQQIRTEVLIQQNPPRYMDLHVSPLLDNHKRFTGRLLVLRDITERRHTEAELARNIEELKIINRISLVITAGLDLERILKALHEQCSQVAPIDIFYVALYEPSSSLINIPLYFKNGQYQTGPSRDIHENPGLVGSVIQSRRTLYMHDDIKQITIPLARSTVKQEEPTKSYIGIPLTVRNQVIGVMSIQSHRRNAYTEDQVHLLERIAVQAAIAIENARLYAEEQRLAIVDELTGVYNYRGLMELGTREVERSRRFDRPLSALFFDIDDFRDFNNTYSHATGNIVLQTIVQRCQALLRSIDILARYGGDEFVVLLPETGLDSAEAIAHRLVAEIANDPISTNFGMLGVTISIGVALLTDNIFDLAALIDRANHAEHQAKQGQKSIVAIAT